MPRLDRPLTGRAFRLALLAVCGVAWGVGSGVASSATPVPEQLAEVRGILPGLESGDFAVREAASKRLREDPTLDTDAIGMAMAEPGVSAEQAQRLMTAYRGRFMLSARPALGIGLSMAPDDDRGIVVSQLTRGLPAIDAGLLQWGDIIVSLDGAKTVVSDPSLPRPVREQIALARTISLIQSYRPKETVTLEILRLKDPAAALAAAGVGVRADGQPAPPAEAGPGLPRRDEVMKLRREFERERIEVRVPLGYYADLAGPRLRGGAAVEQAGIVPQDFSYLMQQYGEAAMEARLNRMGVRWPGGAAFDAASKIEEAHALPPPAYTARLALGLDGAGIDPAAQDSRTFAARQGLAFAGVDQAGRQLFRAPNGMVHIPRGVQVQLLPGRPPAVEDGRGGRRAGAGVGAAGGVEASQAAASGDPVGQPSDLIAPSVDPAVERGLARLATLTSELARAEQRAGDPKLDPPTQREAERRAAELRRAVEALVDAVSKGGAGTPTAEADGEAGR